MTQSCRTELELHHSFRVSPELRQKRLKSGRRQEVDRVDDRHRRDILLGTEIKRAHALHDLVGQQRRVHIRRLQGAE